MQWTSERMIESAPGIVFAIIADPDEFQRAVGGPPVEYLGSTRAGAGTRFSARRTQGGREMAFEQEVTELVHGDRVRLLNVTHGTEWDSVFSVRARGAGGSVLHLHMEARTRRLLMRVMMRLMHGRIQRALDRDMDAVKAHCER